MIHGDITTYFEHLDKLSTMRTAHRKLLETLFNFGVIDEVWQFILGEAYNMKQDEYTPRGD